jgi:hypothetical protein
MRRALLLSGGHSPQGNYPRYWNDVRAFHRVLRHHHGFTQAEIRVCYADGEAPAPDPDGPDMAASLRPASPAEVAAGLSWLAESEAGDLALLVVSNHGHPDRGICLWGPGSYLHPGDLEAALAHCAATKVLVFGQCFAGRFSAMTLENSVLCCACDVNEASHAVGMPSRPGPQDEFLYHMAGALAGRYPDGKPLLSPVPPPAEITVAQAFEYSRTHDRWVVGWEDEKETPTIHESPPGLAGSTRLTA